MFPIFPERFLVGDFAGPRAQEFQRREDAFQQLVGDGLRASFGSGAKSVTTSGADGSIDAWVDDNTHSDGPFADVPGPFIVECKDHDDSLSGWLNNLRGGWSAVKSKLIDAAANGWEGRTAPWKLARGYVYCVSPAFGSVEDRNKLEDGIRDFFAQLPVGQRPPIECVRVLDWSDLRPWLQGHSQVVGNWLGTGLASIQEHLDFVATLVGFRQFLLPKHLPFVFPPDDSTGHPQALFKRLSAFSEPQSKVCGVLIVGAGGVGKSRTSLEVATLAHDAGWRVLHVQPSDTPLRAKDLSSLVLSSSGSLLLVFDYLDQMPELDLAAFRREVLNEARARGIRLAVLGNSRPGWMRHPPPELGELLQRVDLQPEPRQRSEIMQSMVQRSAPQAIEILGEEETRRLCGSRPIIALLIARVLEQQARAGELYPETTSGWRGGDLADWLRRRLGQDDLLPAPSESALLPRSPEPPVLAAAAALAVALGFRSAMITAATAALKQSGFPRPSQATHIVESLEKLGWLENHFDVLFSAHDVVADEVLDQSVRDGSTILAEELSAVLAGALQDSILLKRYAVSIDRLVGSFDSDDPAANLIAAAQDWLVSHVRHLGQMLADAESDLGGYAVGALLASGCWAETVHQEWDELVLPWLRNYGTLPAARHVLYIGLKQEHSDHLQELVTAAFNWLQQDELGLSREAGFVLGPLVARNDLDASQSPLAITHALDWLSHEQHRLDVEAQFVLHPLLSRTDLDEPQSQLTITHAFAWLSHEQHGLDAEARFVLHPLLSRTDLDEPQSPLAITHALDWLSHEQHGLHAEAQFVLHPLLSRTDLYEPQSQLAITHALDWLSHEQHGLDVEAQFVLNSLLSRTDLDKPQSQLAITHALDWVSHEQHGLDAEARFVLQPLLSRTDLDKPQSQLAITHALNWVSHEQHGIDVAARFVLHPLLSRTDLDEPQSQLAITHALDWLEVADHAETTESRFVLHSLLRRGELASVDANRVIRVALGVLQSGLPDTEATFLLRSILQRRLSDQQLDQDVTTAATDWVKDHPTESGVDFVFNRVLRRPWLDGKTWVSLAAIARFWLQAERRSDLDTDYTLNSLLTRPLLYSREELTELICESVELVQRTQPADGKLATRIRIACRALPEDDSTRASVLANPALIRGFEAVVVKLKRLAAEPGGIPYVELDEFCSSVAERACQSLSSAVYAVPPLIALATRGGRRSRQRVLDQLKNISFTSLAQGQQYGFWKEFEKLAEGGAFGLFLDDAMEMLDQAGFDADFSED